MAYGAHQEPLIMNVQPIGSSSQHPILVPPLDNIESQQPHHHLLVKPIPVQQPSSENTLVELPPQPLQDQYQNHDVLSWSYQWFEVPAALSPGDSNSSYPSSSTAASTSQFATDMDLPELDHSQTPESSPVSLHETCMTPVNAVVCDVPLLAPRPLPFTPPAFLQFELPDVDEDLSFPPYTYSKRKTRKRRLDHRSPTPTAESVLHPAYGSKRQKQLKPSRTHPQPVPGLVLDSGGGGGYTQSWIQQGLQSTAADGYVLPQFATSAGWQIQE